MSTYVQPTVYQRSCTVTRVVDGDTLHLVIDPGMDLTVAMTVRLYGINCPELSTEEGRVAAEFTTEWVSSNGPVFEPLTVKDKKEKYGRYLADLVPIAGGESLCQALLRTDNAVVYLP